MQRAHHSDIESPQASTSSRQHRRRGARVLIAACSAITLLLLLSGVASAHALLVRSNPAQGAILDQDQVPSQARLWFTEEVNPTLSKVAVVDQSNHEVDRQDSRVSSSDPKEIDVGLPRLGPGAYVVIWRTVSANDGHPAAGSFIFLVRFPDGSVPAVPVQRPTGPANFGTTTNQCLAGPDPLLCLPLVISEWAVFVMATIWVGGVFWLFVIAEGAARRDSRLVPTAIAAARRFRLVAFLALAIFLLANIGYILGQAMLAGGSVASGFSPTIWGGILLHSRFGVFWLLRQILALLALLLLFLLPERPVSPEDWRPHVRASSVRLLLALLLLVAMAFSGHAAAAQQSGGIKEFAIPVDWLHLLSTSLWVGGLLFIALVIFPASQTLPLTTRAYAWAKLFPRFSGIALASVAVAALSGSYNADVQLTSWDQFLNTAYGRTLIIKILLFLFMVAISAYHAFRIRPALSRQLSVWERLQAAQPENAALALANGAADQPETAQIEAAHPREEALSARKLQRESGTLAASGATAPAADSAAEPGRSSGSLRASLPDENEQAAAEAPISDAPAHQDPQHARVLGQIERLSTRLRFWIRQEAWLGLGVLLCASLLGGLAGTLVPLPPGAPNFSAPAITATSKTPVDMTQTKDGLQITFKVDPDKFGTNSFGVVVVDASTGKPIDNASVHLVSTMLDMDMGTQSLDLKGQGSGFYLGQGDLTMGGHWQIVVQVRVPSDPTTIHRFTFLFSASF